MFRAIKNLTSASSKMKFRDKPIFTLILLFLTNYNLLFTITINNFSDSDDNKIKLKKIKKCYSETSIDALFSGFDCTKQYLSYF